MNKKLIRTISWILLFLFINQGYCVRSEAFDVNDGTWEVIDTARVGSGGYLNVVINSLITADKKKIYIKDGSYELSDSISINKSDVIIYGQSNKNTKLLQKNSGAKSIVVTESNISVSNLYIDGSAGKEVFHAQNGPNVHDVSLEDCIIYGSRMNSAVAFYGESRVNKNSHNSILRNKIYSPTGVDAGSTIDGAVVFYWQKDGFVNENTIIGSRLWLNECEKLVVNKNTIEDSITEGGIIANLPGNNLKISNNIIKNTTESAIAVFDKSSNSTRYSGIEITKNNIIGSKYFGIEVSNLQNAMILNNNISEIDLVGIYLLYSDNVTVEKNKISNCGKSLDVTSSWKDLKASILLDTGVKNSIIEENIVSNTPDQCLFAIKIKDDATSDNTYNKLTNNVITGNFNVGISAKEVYPEYTVTTTKIPLNIIATVADDNIILSWDGITGVTDYEVEIGGIPPTLIQVNGTSYTHSGLVLNSDHTYRVRMKYGNWSLPVSAKAMAVPKNLRTSATDTSIKVEWDGVTFATGYVIEVDKSEKDVDLNNYYNHINLLSHSDHKYRIKIEGGQWSDYVLVTTLTTTQSAVITSPPAVTPTPAVTTPPAVTSTNSTTPAAVNISGNGSSSRRRNHPWYDLEFSLMDEKTLFYKENLIQDTEENKLKRMLLYTFRNKYYISIKTWRKDESVFNKQFEINLIPWKLFTEDEIKNISIDKNDTMDTILVEDMNQQSSLTNPDGETGFSEYSIADGYIFTLEKYEMQLEIEQRYIRSYE